MTINKTQDGNSLTVALEGRLDTTTAPQLEGDLKDSITADITELTFDLKELQYISSAGLRVLLSTQKRMDKQGSMRIINANEDLMDIFEVTGFVEILTIV
ncbi:MAG: STAS domain-containing protein [Lachnospiraceae bacterium]|nr:STAS domain-containing protein [Lachnospiraceae bacterium]